MTPQGLVPTSCTPALLQPRRVWLQAPVSSSGSGAVAALPQKACEEGFGQSAVEQLCQCYSLKLRGFCWWPPGNISVQNTRPIWSPFILHSRGGF